MTRALRLRHKLALVQGGTALLVFALMGLGLAVYQALTLESRARELMTPYAELIAVGADAAIAFEDPERAREILASLQTSPQIREAALLLEDGRTLARHGAPRRGGPGAPREAGLYVDADAVELVRELPRGGSLRLVMGLAPLRRQAAQTLWAFAAAVIVLLALTVAQVLVLERTIVRPVAALTEAAERVRGGGDYGHRVPASGQDEVGRLGESFNAMLDAVRAREDELRRLQQGLEQRVAERTAALEAANRELEAFAYSVSHDLRAPLRHIDGFVSLLERSAAATLDEQSRHYLAATAEAARRMGALIDDLLSFSRTGRAALSATRVDLAALAADVIHELEPEGKGRTVRWRAGALPVVTGDRAMLRVVLVNLLANALKFTRGRDPAEIELGTATAEDGVEVVFVRDNGAGFDMRYAGKLFGVFQRLHRPEEFEGTGIGLATVRRIVARHGGRTWAEGAEGAGATFYFSLPRAPPAA